MNDDTNEDDLLEFADYLAEFPDLLNFDNEVCPTCGVNLSYSLSTENAKFVVYRTVKSFSELASLQKKLKLLCVPFKVEKKLNTEITESINYVYDVYIPLQCLSELNNLP